MKTVNVIEAVFFAALDKKDPRERAEYLEQACVGDVDLRKCVEKLLAAQPNVGEFLQAPAPGIPVVDAKSPTIDHPSDERPGTILGPYKLLHEIGEGGMGTVWMAEQTEPVKRRVALKVIKPGMDSKQVLARFEAERQALALMDHPNIAKVLDAGATDAGRPYFVMELVKGAPITEFCDKNRLATRERLELFVSVCHAIQHAHQKGIIHRDVKPSNVLVALYDGKPVPKVIDFGVAKAMAEPLTTKTLFTRHGQVVGTFEYMSPEQATLDQVDIDTRSDVYSLGVLLYELLTSTTPLDKERLKKGGLGEILRLIREEEPPKPSTRLTTAPGLLASAAAYRQSDSSKLAKLVRGELDWIVMKALDKDRNRRFATANSLADDVERYLKDEPVQACPPTLSYRLRKYARKHKVAFATTSAIAAALLIGIALTGWQAVRATNAERATATALAETAGERDKTAGERDKAVKLSEQLDTRLDQINAANEKIRRDQAARRADQYAWDLQMVPLTLESGNVGEARRMLERQDRELRGFEWHYWNGRMHTERTSIRLPGLPGSRSMLGATGTRLPRIMNWTFSGDGTRIAYLTGAEGTRANRDDKPTVLVWEVATGKLLRSHTISVEGPEGSAGVSDLSGYVSLSHDGQRVSVSATIEFLVTNPETGGQRRSGPLKNFVRVIDVESGNVCYAPGASAGDFRTRPNARLSPDGRKLLTFSLLPGGPRDDSSGLGRNVVLDLDAVDKKPVIIDKSGVGVFSPDGKRIITWAANDDDETRSVTKVWDAASGKELLSLPVPNAIASPRWTYLAAVVVEEKVKNAGLVQTLKVFEGTTGKEISSTPLPGAQMGPFSGLLYAFPIFSPDESLIAVPLRATSGAGQRIDWSFVEPQTGSIRRTIESPVESNTGSGFGRTGVGPQLFSGDGTQFIVCADNTIHTFNVASGQPVHTFRGHVNAIVRGALAPKPDDHLLRTIEADGMLKEWDLRPPQAPPRIAVAERPNTGANESGFIAAADYTVSAGGEWAALFTPGRDGKRDTVRVWNIAVKEPTILEARPSRGRVVPRNATPLLISADGKRVALLRVPPSASQKKDDPDSPPTADVTVWDVVSGKELRHIEFPGWPAGPFGSALRGISNDGATLCLVRMGAVEAPPNGTRSERSTPRSTLRTIDVETGRAGPTITLDGSMLPVAGALSPDSKRYASFFRTPVGDGTWTNHFGVWDLVRGSQVYAVPAQSFTPADPPGINPPGMGATFWSPDGSRLAVVRGPGSSTISLLDAATGKLIHTMTPSTRGAIGTPSGQMPRIAFSPDGRRLACAARLRNGAVFSVLDTDSGKEVLSLQAASDAFPLNAATRLTGAPLTFSPDGHRLLNFTQETYIGNKDFEGKPQSGLRLRTWDATPLPEAKGP